MKKVIGIIIIMIICLLSLNPQKGMAQEESKKERNYKNTVRFNLTNPFIFGGRSLIIGYERLVGKNQSFSVNFGTTGFPNLSLRNSDSVEINSNGTNEGFNFSADYRFYLAKENKYPAPRGVYIGPYYSYNYFENTRDIGITSRGGSHVNANTRLRLDIHTVGFEMGYQFVFWDRVALDMILIGPGVSAYSFEASINTDTHITAEDKQKFFDMLSDGLAEKFPGYGLVVNEGTFKNTGVENTTSFGYRFMIQVGFRF